MKRIFLVGSPRSGTTLYQRLVASHPSLTTFPESHFFWHLCGDGRWRRALRLARRGRARRQLLDFLRAAGEERLAPRVEAFSAPFFGAWVELFVGLLDAVAGDRGATGWLEKTPMHLQYLPLIERYLDAPRALHIVRPAEQVVASMRRVTREHAEAWGGERSVEESVERWLIDVEQHRRFLGRPRHFFALYEELVADPERVLRETCRFLGLEFSGAMLEGGGGDGMVRPDEPWKDGARREVSAAERTRVAEVLTEEERAYVRSRTGSVDLSDFAGRRRGAT